MIEHLSDYMSRVKGELKLISKHASMITTQVEQVATKKYTSVMIRVCHGRSRFLSCMYIHDDFMTESR